MRHGTMFAPPHCPTDGRELIWNTDGKQFSCPSCDYLWDGRFEIPECLDSPLPESLVVDWQIWFANHLHYGWPLDFDLFNHPVLFPLQRQREMEKMLSIPTSKRVVMEIGADKGGGFMFWAKDAKKAIAVEIRGTPYSEQFELGMKDTEFLFIAEPSQWLSTVMRIKDFLDGELIDCLFIDGDKNSYLEDFTNYLPLMRRHGVVFMHDVNEAGGIAAPPGQVYRHLSKNYPTKLIIDVTEAEEALKREQDGIPPANAHEGWLRHWGITSCGVGCIFIE